MRIKSLNSKCRNRDIITKTTLSSLNVYFALINYLNKLNFLIFRYLLIILLKNL